MLKIWQKYFFQKLTSAFLFSLSAMIFLYIAIDLSINGAHSPSKDPFFLIHSLSMIAKLAGFFFPLSFLLAFLKTIFDLHAQREILALQTSGASTKKLLLPFFSAAAILCALSYANYEWIVPRTFEKATTSKVFSIEAEDGSEIVYHRYDPKSKTLYDVFWILSFDDFWWMETLDLSQAQGFHAEHFVKNQRTAFFEKISLTHLPLQPKAVVKKLTPFEQRSLSNLIEAAYGQGADQHKALAHLHYKLSLPLLPFLCVFAISPFALKFSRNSSRVALTALSLFVFVALITLFDALLILAENQVLSAPLALWSPILCLLAPSLVFFSRIR